MKNEDVVLILEEIREMADHWFEDLCHEKCHEIMTFCTTKISEIKESNHEH